MWISVQESGANSSLTLLYTLSKELLEISSPNYNQSKWTKHWESAGMIASLQPD